MKLRYKATLLVGAAVLGGGLFVVFQLGPTYDSQKVHPRLRTLQQPYKTVKTYYFMDGGSIGIRIIDRDGHQEDFAILALLGQPNPYTRVLVGGLHYRVPGAVELSEPEHTRRMLICILRDYPNRTPWDDANLASLRGYLKDDIKVLYHRCRGNLDANGTYFY
jgi:hypothetical protein